MHFPLDFPASTPDGGGLSQRGEARDSLSPGGGAVVCHWQGLESFGF